MMNPDFGEVGAISMAKAAGNYTYMLGSTPVFFTAAAHPFLQTNSMSPTAQQGFTQTFQKSKDKTKSEQTEKTNQKTKRKT